MTAAADRPLSPLLMNRRDALLRVGTLVGGTMVGGPILLSGCAVSDSRPAEELFSAADIALLDEIAETILPATATPGAREAGVAAFITVMVADTYTADEQAIFFAGLEALNRECLAEHGVAFTAATAAQRTTLLERLDREQHAYMQARREAEPVHHFRMLKELTLNGYFTSEVGYTQAMRYLEAPGRFDPCAPYSPGDRAWADHA